MDEATGVVVIVKVADVVPAGTTTVGGAEALVELELNVTEAPPVGAMPLRVIVPVEELPPTTDVGDTERAETVAGVIESVAD